MTTIYLGTADGGPWGYQQSVRYYAHVEIRRQSSFACVGARLQETVEHETVLDPLELSVTHSVYTSGRRDLGGGFLEPEDLACVTLRVADNETFARLERLIPWHSNNLQAGCAHQEVVWEDSPYGRRPSLSLTLPCPVTGYKYGHAWLVKVLPDDVLADAVALGAVVPPEVEVVE